MEQLSIWNDITTITQRYLNVQHMMTRIDEHPRRLNQGRNISILGILFVKISTLLEDSVAFLYGCRGL